MMLEKSSTPDTLSNRVVHVSVQLFSNESLALKMTNELSLLHVMVISLKYMMAKILIPNTLHGMLPTSYRNSLCTLRPVPMMYIYVSFNIRYRSSKKLSFGC